MATTQKPKDDDELAKIRDNFRYSIKFNDAIAIDLRFHADPDPRTSARYAQILSDSFEERFEKANR
jgi:hypothetical protein